MNEQQVKNLINQQIQMTLGSFNKPVVPTHIHNGVDAPQVRSDDLLPYTIENTVSSNVYMAITGIVGTFLS